MIKNSLSTVPPIDINIGDMIIIDSNTSIVVSKRRKDIMNKLISMISLSKGALLLLNIVSNEECDFYYLSGKWVTAPMVYCLSFFRESNHHAVVPCPIESGLGFSFSYLSYLIEQKKIEVVPCKRN